MKFNNFFGADFANGKDKTVYVYFGGRGMGKTFMYESVRFELRLGMLLKDNGISFSEE